MTVVPSTINIQPLTRWIRTHNVLHLDFSGMFTSDVHVRKVMKAVKKSKTLLAIHLSNTPVLFQNAKLQAYIRKKLNTTKMRQKKECINAEEKRKQVITEFIE